MFWPWQLFRGVAPLIRDNYSPQLPKRRRILMRWPAFSTIANTFGLRSRGVRGVGRCSWGLGPSTHDVQHAKTLPISPPAFKLENKAPNANRIFFTVKKYDMYLNLC